MELGESVRLDAKAGKPLFDQLRTQLIGEIRAGRLAPGTRLPTVRELAGQLHLAVNTVARAYRELEGAGIVETEDVSALSSPGLIRPTRRWRPRPGRTSTRPPAGPRQRRRDSLSRCGAHRLKRTLFARHLQHLGQRA
ncbi:bacterial regulatory s, gntR family protein [Mycobacterium xenopi 3993]|nr:bacterial regulatory s, gntR family protein [Mycobacterium xenopi 3993]